MLGKKIIAVALILFVAGFTAHVLAANYHECEDQGRCEGQCWCEGVKTTHGPCYFSCSDGQWCQPGQDDCAVSRI